MDLGDRKVRDVCIGIAAAAAAAAAAGSSSEAASMTLMSDAAVDKNDGRRLMLAVSLSAATDSNNTAGTQVRAYTRKG